MLRRAAKRQLPMQARTNPNPPKTAYFRRILTCRLCEASASLHHPHKTSFKNPLVLDLRFLCLTDFYAEQGRNAVNPAGLTSILTQLCEKSAA